MYILLAFILSSTSADFDGNQTTSAGRDDDFDKQMAAATLSKIAGDFNSTASEQALLAVSEILLSSGLVEDALETTQTDETDFSDEEAINESVNSSTQDLDEMKNSRLEEDKKIIDNVLLGIRAMPDNATIWELFQAQIQADFAPILIILPRPIKRLIGRNIVKVAQKLQIIFLGPTIHMVCVAGRVVEVVGQSLIRIGEDVIKVSHFISSADHYMTEKKNVIHMQKISENGSNTRETDLMAQDKEDHTKSPIISDAETDFITSLSPPSDDDLVSGISIDDVDSDSNIVSESIVLDDSLYDPLSDAETVRDSNIMDLDADDNGDIEDTSKKDYIEI